MLRSIILRDETRFLSGSTITQFSRTVGRARDTLGLRGEIGITLVNDETMEQFGHGKTDVLAFPYETAGTEAGDVFINTDYVKRIRKKSQWLERTEELAVHALVHLAGHTHDNFRDYLTMRQKEIEVLKRPCLPPWEHRVEY